MKIIATLNDDAVLAEIGQRLARVRLDQGMTQAELAYEAGLSKRSIERLEAGDSVQFVSLIGVLRVLGRLGGLDSLLPEPGIRPLDLLALRGKERQRASKKQRDNPVGTPWTWGD
jgi:transcriptional regulator with XRE-family HTH domain